MKCPNCEFDIEFVLENDLFYLGYEQNGKDEHIFYAMGAWLYHLEECDRYHNDRKEKITDYVM